MTMTATETGVVARPLKEVRDLFQLEPSWRALLEDSGANEPSVSPEWMLAWWAVYGPTEGRRLCCLRFEEQGELIGLAPLCSRRHWYRPGLPFRRLELLASAEGVGDIVCSDYLNLLARRGHEGVVAAAFIEALAANRAGEWDELVIPHMDGAGVMPALLVGEAERRGWQATCELTTCAPYIRLPATWEGYLGQLDKKDRYLVNRSLRDFDAWAAGQAVLHEAADERGLEEGRRILQHLHHERWDSAQDAGSGQKGMFRTPLFLAFHDRLMPALLRQGKLELLWLTVRDEPVAAIYNIRTHDKVSFYQCGRKTDVPKNIRPGGVLLYRAIQRAIAGGMREFDFLGGEALYKRQLTRTVRPLVRLRLARPGLLERARQQGERMKDLLRPLWRRIRGKALVASPSREMVCDKEGGRKAN